MSKREPSKRSDEYKSVFGNIRKEGSEPSGSADWAMAASATVCRLISVVSSRGGAVRFGYTRDGGAYAVGFYYGDDHVTKYCRPSDDLEQWLTWWIDFYEALPNTGGISPQ